MKKFVCFSLIILTFTACKKQEFSPVGPTDVRVKNISDVPFNEVIVNTSGGIDTLGNIIPGGVSEYSRFEKAFPKAEITAKIAGTGGQVLLFSTGAVNYNGMTWVGQAKITYSVWISDYANRTLQVSLTLDAPLD
jgi:hypothetical protein